VSAPAGARVTLKGRVGEWAAWGIAAIAWGISLASQVGLAFAHGFRGWSNIEALGDGLLPDLASLSMMMLALDQAERGRPARLTWGLSILAGVFMEWANIAYAWPDPEAVILHAWPPFLVVATLYVLVHTRRTNAAPAAGQVIDVPPAPEPDRPVRTEPNRTEPLSGLMSGPSGRGSLSEPPAPRALPAARVTEAMWAEALSALGPNATNEQLGERLGCHPDSVRRYRRRFAAVRVPPHVVSADA